MRTTLLLTVTTLLIGTVVAADQVALAAGPEQPCYTCENNGCATLDPAGPLAIGNTTCITVYDEEGQRCYPGSNFCVVGILGSLTLDATRYVAAHLGAGDPTHNCDGTILRHRRADRGDLPVQITL